MSVVDRFRAMVLAQIAAIDRDYRKLKPKERQTVHGGGASPVEYAEFSAACLRVIDRATPKQINDGLAQVLYGKAECDMVGTWLGLAAGAGLTHRQAAVFTAQVRGFLVRYPA